MSETVNNENIQTSKCVLSIIEGKIDVERELNKSYLEGFDEDFFANDFFDSDEDNQEYNRNEKGERMVEVKKEIMEECWITFSEDEDMDNNLQRYSEGDYSDKFHDNDMKLLSQGSKRKFVEPALEKQENKTRKLELEIKSDETVLENKRKTVLKIYQEVKSVETTSENIETKILRPETARKDFKIILEKQEKKFTRCALIGSFANIMVNNLQLPNVFGIQEIIDFDTIDFSNNNQLTELLKQKPNETLFIFLITYDCFSPKYSIFTSKKITSNGVPFTWKETHIDYSTPSIIEKPLTFLKNFQARLNGLGSVAVFVPLCPLVFYKTPSEQKNITVLIDFEKKVSTLLNERNFPMILSRCSRRPGKTKRFFNIFYENWMNLVRMILQKNNISYSSLRKFSKFSYCIYDPRNSSETEKKLYNKWDAAIKEFIMENCNLKKKLKSKAPPPAPNSAVALAAATEKNKLYWCDICKINLENMTKETRRWERNREIHIAGKKHKSKQASYECLQKLREQEKYFSQDAVSNVLRCILCSEEVATPQLMEVHFNGAKHRSKVQGATTDVTMSTRPEDQLSIDINLLNQLHSQPNISDKYLKKFRDLRWTSLTHKGPVFPEAYVRLPKHIKFLYNGVPMELSERAEEVAGFYAKILDLDYTSNEMFNNNFFKDWRDQMTLEEKEKITNLSSCNFRQIFAYYIDQNNLEQKKIMPKTKREKKMLNEEYGWCIIDGHKQRVSHFIIYNPHLILSSRRKNLKPGMLKPRIEAEDISINCSKDSIPEPPPGHKWKNVCHDNTMTWLTCCQPWGKNYFCKLL